MFVVFGIGALLMLLATGYVCYKVWRDQGLGRTKQIIWTNIGLIGFVLVMFWWLFPMAAHHIIYRVMFLHMFHLIPVALGFGLIIFVGVRLFDEGRSAMAVMYFVLGVIVIVGGFLVISSRNDLHIYRAYQPEKRQAIVEIDPNVIRFTPLEVAHVGVEKIFGSSKYRVMQDHTRPIEYRDRFQYIIPITPDGIAPTLWGMNNGFMRYDDGARTNDGRIHRIQQIYKFGEEMEYLDNLYRRLHRLDRTVVYDSVRYYPLDPTNDQRFTAIIPRIKYRYKFPCYFVPMWDGVVLYDGQNSFEVLNAKQALADLRLKDKWIQSEWLHRKIVDAQVYDQGWIGGWFWVNREGKIQIPQLPSANQMPFYSVGNNGEQYLVTSTKPWGDSHAIYRMYYQNATTGEFTYYEYPIDAGLLGPVAAIDFAKAAIEGLKWVESTDKGEVGDYRIIEPVYLTKGQELWWKYTVTTRSYTSIVWTVVVNAASDPSNPVVKKFSNREDFERWLRGEEVEETTNSILPETPTWRNKKIGELKELLLKAQRLLEEIAGGDTEPTKSEQ